MQVVSEKEWSIVWDEGEQEITSIRMPCPIMQAVINRAHITEEFKTFLRSLSPQEHLLFINFQDRTSWKEHARSVAIEELARHAEFAQNFTVVTLAKDTDFYNQTGIYQGVNQAQIFIDHFNQHLGDEITGYYFPPQLKKELFPRFMNDLLVQIHACFFDSKEELSFLERLDFIELAYHFIELKLLEICQPSHVSFSSKDGLDIGGTASIGLIALLTIHHKKKWSEKEYDRLITILFGPTLMNRERVIHPERFERLAFFVKLLEEKNEYLNKFATLYNPQTLKGEINLVLH